MDKHEIRYALLKQISSMEYIHTSYGEIELDPELAQAVQEALERVFIQTDWRTPPG